MAGKKSRRTRMGSTQVARAYTESRKGKTRNVTKRAHEMVVFNDQLKAQGKRWDAAREARRQNFLNRKQKGGR